MKMNNPVLILGAGISGLGAAYKLSCNGQQTVVLEKDTTYGGLCGNFTIDGFRFDRFVHFSFAKDEQVNRIFMDGAGEVFRHVPNAYNLYQGIWIKHPAQNNLYPLSQKMKYNPQIQISAESETKRSIFREKDKTKRSKKESAQHSKSRNKSFVMTSVSAL